MELRKDLQAAKRDVIERTNDWTNVVNALLPLTDEKKESQRRLVENPDDLTLQNELKVAEDKLREHLKLMDATAKDMTEAQEHVENLHHLLMRYFRDEGSVQENLPAPKIQQINLSLLKNDQTLVDEADEPSFRAFIHQQPNDETFISHQPNDRTFASQAGPSNRTYNQAGPSNRTFSKQPGPSQKLKPNVFSQMFSQRPWPIFNVKSSQAQKSKTPQNLAVPSFNQNFNLSDLKRDETQYFTAFEDSQSSQSGEFNLETPSQHTQHHSTPYRSQRNDNVSFINSSDNTFSKILKFEHKLSQIKTEIENKKVLLAKVKKLYDEQINNGNEKTSSFYVNEMKQLEDDVKQDEKEYEALNLKYSKVLKRKSSVGSKKSDEDQLSKASNFMKSDITDLLQEIPVLKSTYEFWSEIFQKHMEEGDRTFMLKCIGMYQSAVKNGEQKLRFVVSNPNEFSADEVQVATNALEELQSFETTPRQRFLPTPTLVPRSIQIANAESAKRILQFE